MRFDDHLLLQRAVIREEAQKCSLRQRFGCPISHISQRIQELPDQRDALPNMERLSSAS